MGIGKPQQAKQAYDDDLADDRKTIDEEGTKAASDGRFN